MNLFAVRKHADKVLHPLVASAARLPLHANHWTLLGAFIGLICGVAFLYTHWWLGLVLLLVRGLMDHIDGYVARNRNQRSTFGAVMDDVSDRWVLGIIYAGGCLALSTDYPHVLIVLGFGITGSLSNVIVKLSLYAESHQDVFREEGKIGHPVDVVGIFGSAEFIIYYGAGVFCTALLNDPRPMLAGIWAVAIMSHVSLVQRIAFAWQRYRRVDPAARIGMTPMPSMTSDEESAKSVS
ncbi:MAG: CDP-alcohol phosphatidyltransferase family protein [Proteobacteria bacterium]|nr:CDP-alcohol phosphatidyltransferase family protein [Pseudomonadota bacterium]